MKIVSIKAYELSIPFNFSIDHHLKSRGSSESVIIEVATEKGVTGHGEGAPRKYVTNEKIKELISTVNSDLEVKVLASEYKSLADINRFVANTYDIYDMPSLTCALELALIDAYGKEENKSLSHYLDGTTNHLIPYSGIIPFASGDKLDKILGIIKELDLSAVKMKVGTSSDLKNIKAVRRILGDDVDIRVDANRSWTLEEAVLKINQLKAFNISCVEEPLAKESVHKLGTLAKLIDIPIMLDESAYTLDHIRHWSELIQSNKLIINLKISKSGGIQRASELYRFAKKKGISCQLGCNAGESAILSAAGRHFAENNKMKYLEGSYGPFFMADDISNTPVTFTKRGHASPLTGKGLGIDIDPRKISQYTRRL